MPFKAHVSDAKKKEVKLLEELLAKYPIIAIAPISGLPAAHFQFVRKKLRGHAEARVTKISLLRLAMKATGKEKLLDLSTFLEGPIAVIFSNVNSFKLYKILKQNMSPAAIKTGAIAPFDLIVPAGDTGLPPGPALGELKVAGINAKIDGGSIKVQKDSVVCKAGDKVSAPVAAALNKLNIKPLQIGMALSGSWELNEIFKADLLDIDEETTIFNLVNSYKSALNLAVNSAYACSASINILIQNANRNAVNLGVNAVVLEKPVVELLLAKANLQAGVLKGMAK